MARSDKFDKALARTEAKGEISKEPATPEAEAVALLTDQSGMIQAFDPVEIMRRIKAEGYIAAEQMLKLEEGQMCEGYLLERGIAKDVTDPNDPKVTRDLPTIRLELSSGARVSMIESSALERMLRDVPANGTTHVMIAKGGKIKTSKNRMMDEYFCFVKLAARKVAPQLAAPAHEDLLGVGDVKATSS